MRRSEVLALRWSDVDLDGGRVTVSRSQVWAAGGFTDNPTKTERGKRVVALDSVTVARLLSG